MAKIMFKSTAPKSCKFCNLTFYHPERNICGWCYDEKKQKNNGNSNIGTENTRLIAWGLVMFALAFWLLSDAALTGAKVKYRLTVIENNSRQ